MLVSGNGVTLDLALTPDMVITDIESIDITDISNNMLKIELQDVLAILSTTGTLIIDGDAGDVVNLQGAVLSLMQHYVGAFKGLDTAFLQGIHGEQQPSMSSSNALLQRVAPPWSFSISKAQLRLCSSR